MKNLKWTIPVGAIVLCASVFLTERLSMNHNENSLRYLYRPAKVQAGVKAPVILLLHGVGSNEADMFNLSEVIDPRFAVYSLRGPLTLAQDSYAWFHVNFTAQGPQHNRDEAESSRVILKNFIKNLSHLNPEIDPSQVFLLGFSQGTIMSLSLGFTEPELVKGVVAISGRTLQEVAAQIKGRSYSRTPQVLLVHGVEDGKLPYSFAQNTESVLKDAGFKYQFKSYPAGHQITPAMLQDIREWLSQK
ncbi:alpha/beta hydrolase [Bdellovibrio sp. HCB209]|uniref:alpha/beta hydrolase n=1 Tax=Bdellovibrio sp. HCB209 TaxID=3394354 RepID=UPI0039B389A8